MAGVISLRIMMRNSLQNYPCMWKYTGGIVSIDKNGR